MNGVGLGDGGGGADPYYYVQHQSGVSTTGINSSELESYTVYYYYYFKQGDRGLRGFLYTRRQLSMTSSYPVFGTGNNMNSTLMNRVFARILVLLNKIQSQNIYNIRLNCAERVSLLVNNNNGCASQKTTRN